MNILAADIAMMIVKSAAGAAEIFFPPFTSDT